MKCKDISTDATARANQSLRILVVDDDLGIRQMLLACVRSQGQDAFAASSSAECLEVIKDYAFDLCFLDLRLGNQSGLELIGPLHAAQPWLRIIVMTAFPGVESAVEAIKLGATNYLSKPLAPTQFRIACSETVSVRSVFKRVVASRSISIQNAALVGLETSCPQMRSALEDARSAAESGAAILIQGEPGTGKRTLAQLIHTWSGREDKPLVFAGCRGPSPTHVSYDWFGSTRERRNRTPEKLPGRITAAGQGTIVVEEVNELDQSLHEPLLRLVERKEFIATGEEQIQSTEARIIATSSASLHEAVIAGSFPPALGDALGVLTITLPPLRRRKNDIAFLAQAYADNFCRTLGKPFFQFDEISLDAMKKHSWPGNVRELKNFVERSVMLSPKGTTRLKDLPAKSLNDCASVSIGDRVPLKRVEEMHIRAVIDASPSIDAAARTLGMDTVTLWRRRKQFGIDN